MDPPPCVQNAMMTKDKKPFTYTPGGIDLSEVRSPRMQRRIERNANLGGVSDMPQQPQPPRPQNVGPLPPATLAAMRPQPQVQVFPGPPPPPPMQKAIPPPPPPPSGPLPTQKVTTGDNQVIERPDMTKIIPDNPMALLRKTGGPAPKKSFVEQMYEEQNRNPPSPPQRAYEAQSPRPPVEERSAPVSPPVQQQRQTQSYQSPPQQYQPSTPPQSQYQPPQQSYQSQYQPAQPPQPQYQPQVQQRPSEPPKPQPSYQPPIIQRQPTMGKQDQPQKTVSSSVGSLYIPPLNQQQPPSHQQKFASPPTPPEREQHVQPPGTPTLKEAPRPWQQKNIQQQQEVPPWARREEEERVQVSQPPQSAPSQRWQQPARGPLQQPTAQQAGQPSGQQFSPRSPPTQQQSPRSPPTQNQAYPSNTYPVHIEIRSVPYPQNPEPADRKPEAVYVTQPIVLQHPGPKIAPPYQAPKSPQPSQPNQNSYQQPRQQVKQPKVDSSGARIIPIQIERTPPTTPGADRGLSRQLSWGTQPPQSNSFKVIQKITKTDDDEDDDTPVTQHSARYPQEMPEQVRRMKINDNGHFKQGNGQPQPYVHPSEQVVPEPKKYMGSNIPSRSFKILQAMTAPSDGCANANYNNELPYNPLFNPYNYPYYPSPYWPDYYPNYYPQEQSEPIRPNEKAGAKSGRSTPLPNATPYPPPYWHDYYSNFYPQQQSDSLSKMSDKSSSTKSGRSTPLPAPPPIPHPVQPPYWGYIPPNMPSNAYARSQSAPLKFENTLRPQTPKASDSQNNYSEESYSYQPYPMYPPYYDPYYYNYYYGYPPMMHPYPCYPPSSENEEYSGYSSQDEMSSYQGRRSSLKRRNSLEEGTNSVQALRQHFEVRSKSATPRITITPSFSQEKLSFNIPPDDEKENENLKSEVPEKNGQNGSNLCRLRSIKSVQNINVYSTEDCSETESESEESEEESEEEEEEILMVHEEIIPHQLSVIFEESERVDSRRSFRPSSAASESTTLAEHLSEEEDIDDFLSAQNVKYKINMFQAPSEQQTKKTFNGKTVRTLEQENDSASTFMVKNQLITENKTLCENKKQNGCIVEEYDSDVDSIQKMKYKNAMQCKKNEKDMQLIEENKHVLQQDTVGIVDNKVNQECAEDWWNVIENKNESDVKSAQNVKYKINLFQETKEQQTIKSFGGKTVKTFNQDSESLSSFKVKSELVAKNNTLCENNNQDGDLWKEYDTDVKREKINYENKNTKVKKPYENTHKDVKVIKENKNVSQPETIDIVDNKVDKESVEDWWNVIENRSEIDVSSIKEASDIREENECDNQDSKAEFVMVHVNTNEVVSVKLRNKKGAGRDNINRTEKNVNICKEDITSDGTGDLFFKTNSSYNRNSVYDILNNEETEEEIVSGGTLMKVGSFVSALEAIKRNSGLWNLEDNNSCKPPIIKEESVDNEGNENRDHDDKKLEMTSINDTDCNKNTDLKDENESDESEVDFWSQIKNDEDDFKPRPKSQILRDEQENDAYYSYTNNKGTSEYTEAHKDDSTSSSHSSFSKSQIVTQVQEATNKLNEYCQKQDNNLNQQYYQDKENNEGSDETSDSESSEEEPDNKIDNIVEERNGNSHSRSTSLEAQKIKERIEALKNSIAKKQKILEEKGDIFVSVKSKVSAIEIPVENRSKTTSTKSSVKSFEEYSEEEEGDSGVNSDISRHISDNEEFPELKKLTRYERAATHSRLFKLLQDECDIEEEEEDDEVFKHPEDKFSRLSVRRNREENKLAPSRSKLSLALNKCNDYTNGPQINEKLVDELVQSLLRSRKAQVFRNMPKEKLRAAAVIILQEGIEGCESPSEEFSSILSPLRGDTESSTPAQTPQEFYADNNEYTQYYDSWSDATTDITPSKAFKLLQGHKGASKLGTIEGILAKCPKILSNKNISKEILKHLDELSSDCSSPYSRNPPQSNDVTNT